MRKTNNLKRMVSCFVALSLVLGVTLTRLPDDDVSALSEDKCPNAENHYCYTRLSGNEKAFYEQFDLMFTNGSLSEGLNFEIEKELSDTAVSAYLDGDFGLADEFLTAKTAFRMDHPEAVYMDWDALGVRVVHDRDGELHCFAGPVDVDGCLTDADIDAYGSALSDIMNGMPSDAGAGGKIDYAYGWLFNNVAYDVEGGGNTAYDAIVSRTGNADALALAFKVIMDNAGVQSACVYDGNGTDFHMCNMVLVDDSWVAVDVAADLQNGERRSYVADADETDTELVQEEDIVQEDAAEEEETVYEDAQNEVSEQLTVSGNTLEAESISDNSIEQTDVVMSDETETDDGITDEIAEVNTDLDEALVDETEAVENNTDLDEALVDEVVEGDTDLDDVVIDEVVDDIVDTNKDETDVVPGDDVVEDEPDEIQDSFILDGHGTIDSNAGMVRADDGYVLYYVRTSDGITWFNDGEIEYALSINEGDKIRAGFLPWSVWDWDVSHGYSYGRPELVEEVAEEEVATLETSVALMSIDPVSVPDYLKLDHFYWGGDEETDADIRWTARRVADTMSLEEQVGQMFIILWNNQSATLSNIRTYKPGGVLLRTSAFSSQTTASMKNRISNPKDRSGLQDASAIPLIITTDEEGGTVVRVSSNKNLRSAGRYQSPYAILQTYGGNRTNALAGVSAQASDMASVLTNLGINMNNAPMADVLPTSSFLYGRAWGGTSAETAAYAATAVSAMENGGLGTNVKHFPGYGKSADNVGNVLIRYTTTDYSLNAMYDMMRPFAESMKAGGESMMVAHSVYNSFDSANSMSMSPDAYDFIRNGMGFDGILMPDGFSGNTNPGVLINGSANPTEAKGALAALKAGADMAIVEDLGAINQAIALANTDKDFRQHVYESCMRVLCWKMAHGMMEYTRASANSNPEFTVEYYAMIDRVQPYIFSGNTAKAMTDGQPQTALKAGVTSFTEYNNKMKSGYLPVLDTTGANLPTNKAAYNNQYLRFLKVTGGELVSVSGVEMEVFSPVKYEYIKAPGLRFFNLFDDDDTGQSNYELTGLRVTSPGGYVKYEIALNSASNLNNLHFTNRADVALEVGSDVNLSSHVWLLIEDGDVIRIICDTTQSTNVDVSANFFDYDISSSITSGSQDSNSFVMMTNMGKPQGINSSNNYVGTGTKYAFGNSNTGTGLDTEKLKDGSTLNKFNSSVFAGCTFGIANDTLTDKVRTSDGIAAPDGMFTYTGAVKQNGKTDYKGTLTFKRDGDTYTLTDADIIGAGSAHHLDTLHHPGYGSTTHEHIYTNDFWPMDGAPTSKRTDSLFGLYKYSGSKGEGNQYVSGADSSKVATNGQRYNKASGSANALPVSDDGLNHNSYFGMSFMVDFELVEAYQGPLEYYFFGDDDMWVYLDGKLICDIGGVHSSVGEFINLWDYIETYEDENGHTLVAEESLGVHELRFFYTERGASGSTCWMQFTLPSVSIVEPEQKTGGLTFKKEVQDANGDVIGQDLVSSLFDFTMYLWMEGENGEKLPLLDDYRYVRLDEDGNQVGDSVFIDSSTIAMGELFQLRAGESIRIQFLPAGTHYAIVENQAEGFESPKYVHAGVIQEENEDEYVMSEDSEIFTVINKVLPLDVRHLLIYKTNGSKRYTEEEIEAMEDATDFYYNGDGTYSPILEGAQFTLYYDDGTEDGEAVPLILGDDGVYRPAEDSKMEGVTFLIDAGVAVVEDLDPDSDYWLEEVTVPEWFYPSPRVYVEFINGSATATVHIENFSMTLNAPATGGRGVLSFIFFGMAFIAAAGYNIYRRKYENVN